LKLIFKDMRFSLRMLRKSPGFTIAAVLTLALGIGANAVVFSVLNSLILRPLDVPEPENLFMLERGAHHLGAQSYPDYVDLRDRNRSFEDLAAYDIAPAGLDAGTNPMRIWVELVSGNYFDALKIQPHVGRVFHASDEHGANSAPYVVLSYAYWHTHFHDDHGVVGRTVQVNKHPFTVVGVAPPEFHGTLMMFHPDLFVPIVNQEQLSGASTLNLRNIHDSVFMVMGHLKAGVTPAQAAADLNSIGAYLEKSYPKEDSQMSFNLERPGLYGHHLGPPIQAFVTGLMLLAGLILLAACANLGSLFAARATDRSREVALRLALGATHKPILRQLFTEALLVSLMGSIVGLLGSSAVLRWLSAWHPFDPGVSVGVNPDTHVYVVALLLTLVSAFLFGAVPVRQIFRIQPYGVIKFGSTGTVGRRVTFRDLLLVGQIAICAVLVTSSIVAVRGLIRSLHSSFGFEMQNAMLADTDLSMAGYNGDKAPVMQKHMISALEAIPGVESVGLIDSPPLYYGVNSVNIFRDQTTDMRLANAAAQAVSYKVSPDYFRAAGTALLSGRNFTWHDDKEAPQVAVINQEFAQKVFGSVSSAVGGYYKMRDGTRIQVVGIAEQGKYTSLTEDPQPAVFLPLLQSPSSSTWIVVRSKREPQQLAMAMKSVLRDLDAALPVNIQTWPQELESALFPSRMAAVSLGVLGVMAAMLAVTGIFGMAAYSVSKRWRELGVRVAVGAQSRQVLQTALGRAVKLLVAGSVAGLFLGILASRVLAAIVYQATPRDPVVLGGVVVAMSLLGLVATWIPARRALAIDPLILMREQ